jgi:TP901 family phage tail tape measure protein
MGAAIRVTKEYQAELIKLNTLVGINIDELGKFDDAFREIAATTGTSAIEVARAAFAITSGGARGAEALEAIEQAAKLSAIGLGDMQTIGRTLTAALQAFGSTGLTASKAADTLAATVREGNLEASELAGALSRVLGPAVALGVSFEDVGAFMATFTRLGGDSAQAATGLLNVFNLLIAPPQQARDAMEEYGVSVERLRQIAASGGLQQALEALSTALGGNIDKLGETVPNVRASNAVLATAVVQAEEYARIQEDVRDANGATERSFATYADTADAQFKRFGATVEGLGLAVGEALLPPLTAVLAIITPVVEGWGMIIDKLDDVARFTWDKSGIETLPAFLFSTMEAGDAATNAIEAMAEATTALGQSLTTDQLEEYINRNAAAIELFSEDLKNVGGNEFRALRAAQLQLIHQNLSLTAQYEERRAAEEQYEERRAAEEEVRAGQADATILTRGQIEAEAERQEAIDELLGSLLQEVELLEQGERAMLANQLETLQATDAERKQALARYDNIKAIEATAKAEEQARAVRARLRRQDLADRIAAGQRADDRRKKLREKLQDQEEKQRQADQRMAQLAEQNRLRDISAAAGDMADAFADAFGSIIKDISNTEQAFKDLLATIARQVQRQAITRLITEPLTDAIVGIFDGGPVDTAGIMLAPAAIPTGKDLTGNNKLTTSSGMSSLRVDPVQSPSSLAVNTGTGQMQTVVQQTINFAPSFIDGADGEAWLRSNSQEIMTIISDGARRSSSYATALRG